jgi:hypothetical protein
LTSITALNESPHKTAESVVERKGESPARAQDAVIQGLSEVRIMRDIEHWGVVTIGIEFGNAHFTNH